MCARARSCISRQQATNLGVADVASDSEGDDVEDRSVYTGHSTEHKEHLYPDCQCQGHQTDRHQHLDHHELCRTTCTHTHTQKFIDMFSAL